MKTGKMILLLGSVLGVFTILAGCDRVDTSDPNATPKPTPTATANPTTDTIDITDDFSKTDSGWGETDDKTEKEDSHYYFGGAYKMHLTGGKTKYFAVPFKDKLDADKGYTIQVEVTNSTTENASVGGLFFNSTDSDGGIFVIDPKNQQYAVQNGWSGLKWYPKEDGTIYKTKPNILKVEVSGTTVKVFINEKPVKEGIGVSKHLGEKVGLYFSSNEEKKSDFTMMYDNFVLKGTKDSSN